MIIENNEFVEYKGRPIVRKEEDLYYGDMSDKYYIYMMIMSDKEVEGKKVPDMIMVQLIDSATKRPENQKVVKGFKEAFEFASAWLDRYNK